eukprot:186424-Prymnesium_polylepis.2
MDDASSGVARPSDSSSMGRDVGAELGRTKVRCKEARLGSHFARVRRSPRGTRARCSRVERVQPACAHTERSVVSVVGV